MTHLCLFSGIGGFALAARWAGWETVQFVEIDPFCQKVLAKNFPGVPIHGDIKTFNGEQYAGRVDILTGGFPCQPFSTAGNRKGKDDDRYLWEEMLRVIREVRPTWIVGENVAGIITMALDEVCTTLEGEGYAVQAFVIPACAVNAPHRRDRVWIVANSDSEPNPNHYCQHREEHVTGNQLEAEREVRQTGGDVYDASWDRNWVEVATQLCRVSNGISEELDKNKRGLKHATKSYSLTIEDLPDLWEHIQQEEIWEQVRGRNQILSSEDVFAVLWQFFRESNGLEHIPIEGEEAQRACLLNVWECKESGYTSQRRSGSEQRPEEFTNSLPLLSYEVALVALEAKKEATKHDRRRLMSLGNAIVPQVAYEIFRVINEL